MPGHPPMVHLGGFQLQNHEELARGRVRAHRARDEQSQSDGSRASESVLPRWDSWSGGQRNVGVGDAAGGGARGGEEGACS